MKLLRALLLVVSFVALLVSGEARAACAGTQAPLSSTSPHWAGAGIPVHWSMFQHSTTTGTAVSGMSFTTLHSAVAAAYATWQQTAAGQGSPISWVEDPSFTTPSGPACINANDGVNRLVWLTAPGSWAAAAWAGPSTLGVTFTVYNTGTNALIDADIAFNADNWSWDTAGAGSNVDVQSIVIHESGHQWGALHTALFGSIMYASYSGGTLRTPNSDDISQLSCLYPPAGNARAQGSPCTAGIQCASGICAGPTGSQICTVTCTGTATCPAGDSCQSSTPVGTTTPQNVCLPQPASGLGQLCNPQPCATGLHCLDDGSGQSKCYGDCNPAAPACPTCLSCVQLVDSTGNPAGGACLPDNFGGGTVASCGACGTTNCAPGNICAGTATASRCYASCDPANPSTCPTVCQRLTGSCLGICLCSDEVSGTGGSCAPTGKFCIAGNVCVSGTCLKSCIPQGAPCPTGLQCVSLATGGAVCSPVGGGGIDGGSSGPDAGGNGNGGGGGGSSFGSGSGTPDAGGSQAGGPPPSSCGCGATDLASPLSFLWVGLFALPRRRWE